MAGEDLTVPAGDSEWLYQYAKLEEALDKLGDKAKADLPDPKDRESPSKRHHSPAHDIKHRLTPLLVNGRLFREKGGPPSERRHSTVHGAKHHSIGLLLLP